MSHCKADINSTCKQIEEKISVNLSWTRPNTVPYPNIWKKLETKSKNGQTYEVRIEDVTPDRYEELLDFMFVNYDCEEPISKLIELSSDPESVAARRAVRRKILEQKISLIATLQQDQNNDKPSKIMGTLILLVNTKNDPPIKVTGKKWTNWMNFVKYLHKDVDPFQLLNSDLCFEDYGLAVAPEYYGLNLGYHLFSCIPQMCEAFEVPGSLNEFTSSFSQSIPTKLGLTLCKEVSYEEFKDENGKQVPMEGTFQYMMLRITK